MYINPYHVQMGLRQVIVNNIDVIGGEIRRFFPNRTLHLFVGRRGTITADNMPSLEIISQGYSPQWFATRTQTATYRLELLLTIPLPREQNADQLIGTISTAIVAVLTNPTVLQFQVQSERRLEQPAPNDLVSVQAHNAALPAGSQDRIGWVAPEPDTTKQRRMLDSFINDVSFTTGNSATFVQATMSWEGQMLQHYVADWSYFGELLTPGTRREFDFLS